MLLSRCWLSAKSIRSSSAIDWKVYLSVCFTSIWKARRLLDLSRGRLAVVYSATVLTGPRVDILLERLHGTLDLTAQIVAVEGGLMDELSAVRVLAVPPHFVDRLCWPRLLKHHANSIRESHGVVRRIRWEEVKTILVDRDIDELVRRL